MSIINKIEKNINECIKRAGYEVDKINLQPSGRPDLGEYQINDAMQLSRKYGKNPRDIANDIVIELEKEGIYNNINIAGPGFINIKFTEEFLINSLADIAKDINNNIDKLPPKKLFIDYGGANIAKTLHVGHLRSANIGEALKRLAKVLGNEVISDVHFGDIGRQSGMVISEIKRMFPNLPYFDENYKGDFSEVKLEITKEDLEKIYPRASILAKENEEIMLEVTAITKDLEEGNRGYVELWKKIKELSIEDIKSIYNRLNTSFDLYEGESDCYPYIPSLIEDLKNKGFLYESDGALVIDIGKEEDNSPMPPLVVIKTNGATLYATRELATLYSRVKRFNPDEFWYLTDLRQGLYFEQVFRASKKTNIVNENTNLEFIGFGTMNGSDGKPFKTRDGGVMNLLQLIELVKEETTSRINTNIVSEDKVEETSEKIAISALKYADFLPYRTTDYVFEPSKFADLEGKTGPYLLYSSIRMKSLLNKEEAQIDIKELKKLKNETDRELIILLFNLPLVLKNSYNSKSLNDIAEYIYKLVSLYNKFYSENKILTEQDEELKKSWIVLTNVVYQTTMLLLDILALPVPEKM
ncbi:MAG: arginine--tRNA ligase [Bacilli bacterium]|nr:arginine--tRNA ligase [Bacilli bacterium]